MSTVRSEELAPSEATQPKEPNYYRLAWFLCLGIGLLFRFYDSGFKIHSIEEQCLQEHLNFEGDFTPMAPWRPVSVSLTLLQLLQSWNPTFLKGLSLPAFNVVLLSLATLLALWWAVLQWLGERAALLALCLATVSPWLIEASGGSNEYGLAIFLWLLGLGYAKRLLDTKGREGLWQVAALTVMLGWSAFASVLLALPAWWMWGVLVGRGELRGPSAWATAGLAFGGALLWVDHSFAYWAPPPSFEALQIFALPAGKALYLATGWKLPVWTGLLIGFGIFRRRHPQVRHFVLAVVGPLLLLPLLSSVPILLNGGPVLLHYAEVLLLAAVFAPVRPWKFLFLLPVCLLFAFQLPPYYKNQALQPSLTHREFSTGMFKWGWGKPEEANPLVCFSMADIRRLIYNWSTFLHQDVDYREINIVDKGPYQEVTWQGVPFWLVEDLDAGLAAIAAREEPFQLPLPEKYVRNERWQKFIAQAKCRQVFHDGVLEVYECREKEVTSEE